MKLSMGIRSGAPNTCLHWGQTDLEITMGSCRGIRQAQRFKKLPTIAPRVNTVRFITIISIVQTNGLDSCIKEILVQGQFFVDLQEHFRLQ